MTEQQSPADYRARMQAHLDAGKPLTNVEARYLFEQLRMADERIDELAQANSLTPPSGGAA